MATIMDMIADYAVFIGCGIGLVTGFFFGAIWMLDKANEHIRRCNEKLASEQNTTEGQ